MPRVYQALPLFCTFVSLIRYHTRMQVEFSAEIERLGIRDSHRVTQPPQQPFVCPSSLVTCLQTLLASLSRCPSWVAPSVYVQNRVVRRISSQMASICDYSNPEWQSTDGLVRQPTGYLFPYNPELYKLASGLYSTGAI